jgi:hypothetical protein
MAREKKRELDIDELGMPTEMPGDEPPPPPVLGVVDETAKVSDSVLGAFDPTAKPKGNGKPGEIDFASQTYPQDFQNQIGVKKVLLTVPVRKPTNQTWWSSSPDPAYRGLFGLLPVKDSSEIYFVQQNLVVPLQKWVKPFLLVTMVTSEGNPFLLPIRRPGADGRTNPAWDGMEDAVKLSWDNPGLYILTSWNDQTRGYDCTISDETLNLPPPEWPTESFNELMNIGFKRYYIDTLEHPYVQFLLRGPGVRRG